MDSGSIAILTLVMAGAGLLHGPRVHAQEVSVTSPAHLHLGHVAEGFRDTPGGKGLLETAAGEASIVARHAGLMVDARDDLDLMKLHAGHVLHAIDPTLEDEGPGLGYGLLRAARAVATHITMAGEAPVATQNVKTHAAHVSTAARNAVRWTEQIVDLAQEIQEETDAEDAAELVNELDAVARRLVPGHDANEDGRVGWQEGEGGLDQAESHLGLMMQGEGLGS